MKKFLIVFISIICLCSCEERTQNEKNIKMNNFNVQDRIELVDIEFNGETHEYVYMCNGYGKSLSHWAGCKYCKEKEYRKSND